MSVLTVYRGQSNHDGGRHQISSPFSRIRVTSRGIIAVNALLDVPRTIEIGRCKPNQQTRFSYWLVGSTIAGASRQPFYAYTTYEKMGCQCLATKLSYFLAHWDFCQVSSQAKHKLRESSSTSPPRPPFSPSFSLLPDASPSKARVSAHPAGS
jgi:hypothetical protein